MELPYARKLSIAQLQLALHPHKLGVDRVGIRGQVQPEIDRVRRDPDGEAEQEDEEAALHGVRALLSLQPVHANLGQKKSEERAARDEEDGKRRPREPGVGVPPEAPGFGRALLREGDAAPDLGCKAAGQVGRLAPTVEQWVEGIEWVGHGSGME